MKGLIMYSDFISIEVRWLMGSQIVLFYFEYTHYVAHLKWVFQKYTKTYHAFLGNLLIDLGFLSSRAL